MAGDIVTTRYIIETVFRATADPAIEQAGRLAREAQAVTAQTTMATEALRTLGSSGSGLAATGSSVEQMSTQLGARGASADAAGQRTVDSLREVSQAAAEARRSIAEPMVGPQIATPSIAPAVATPPVPLAMPIAPLSGPAAGAVSALGADLSSAAEGAAGLDMIAAAGNRATLALTETVAGAGRMAAAESAIRSAATAPPLLVSAVDLIGPASAGASAALTDLAGTATVPSPGGWIAALPGDLGMVTTAGQTATSSVQQVQAAVADLAAVPRLTVPGALAAVVPPAVTARTAVASVGTAATQTAGQTSLISRAAAWVADQLGRLPPLFARSEAASRSFGRTSTDAMDRVGNGIGNVSRQIMGMAGAYIGFQALTGTVGRGIGDQMAMDSVAGGMATIIESNFRFDGVRDFNASLATSRQLIDDIAKDSATLPGSFQDFANMAATLSGPMFAAGKSVDDLRSQVKDMAFAIPIIGMTGTSPQDIAAQSARILMGQAGLDMQTWSYLTSTGAIKRTAEEWNKLSKQQRAEEFSAAIKAMASPEARAYVENTPAVIFSTLSDNVMGVRGLLGQVSSIVMGALVPAAKDLNAWFAHNQESVTAAASAIAGPMVSGIRAATSLMINLANHADQVKMAILAGAAALATYKIGALLPGVAGAGAMSGVAALGTKLLIGAPILPAASLAAFSSALTAATPFIAGAAAILIAVVAPLAGAFIVVQRNLFGLGDWFRERMGGLGTALLSLGGTLGGLFQALAVPLGVVLVPVVGVLAFALEKIVWLVDLVLNTVGGFVAGISALLGGILADPYGYFTDTTVADEVETAAYDAWNSFRFSEIADKMASVSGRGSGADIDKKMAEAAAKGGNVTNINGPVTLQMEFEKDPYPDRIAIGVFDELRKVSRRLSRTPGVLN